MPQWCGWMISVVLRKSFDTTNLIANFVDFMPANRHFSSQNSCWLGTATS